MPGRFGQHPRGMAFNLQAHEGMAAGLRRIALEEVDRAIEQVAGRGDADRDSAIHDARKRLKKARAVARLARFELGGARRVDNDAMRDAARRLSGARDAHVLVGTLDALRERTPDLPEDAVGDLRAVLVAQRSPRRATSPAR
jgi:hypothetical protein